MSYAKCLMNQYNEFRQIYKKVHKRFPSHSIEAKTAFTIKYMMDARAESNDTDRIKYQYIYEAIALDDDINKRATHYYITDDFIIDFLVQTKVKDVEPCVHYISDNSWTFNEGDSVKHLTMFIHTKKIAFTLVYLLIPSLSQVLVYVFTDHCNYEGFLNCDDKEYETVYQGSEGGRDEALKLMKIASNFIYYMKAFPECIIDGVPKEVSRKNSGTMIKVSDKIVSKAIHETTGIVMPFPRRGYFKELKSDFYVNKKGQTIFIHETMVRGRSKTVIKSEEI